MFVFVFVYSGGIDSSGSVLCCIALRVSMERHDNINYILVHLLL